MTKKKAIKRVTKKINGEDNFRFALNAAVLAVLVGLLVMLVNQMGTPITTSSRAQENVWQLGR